MLNVSNGGRSSYVMLLSIVTFVKFEELEDFLTSIFASSLHYRRLFAKPFSICNTNAGGSMKVNDTLERAAKILMYCSSFLASHSISLISQVW